MDTSGTNPFNRPAVKAGSWYPADKHVILEMMDSWLNFMPDDKDDSGKTPKFLIVPHAGFKYSGSTAAHSYKKLDGKCTKILLLHPSHYAYLDTLKQSPFHSASTPIGLVPFSRVPEIGLNEKSVDVGEHSAELQFPFIQHIGYKEVWTVMVGDSWTNSDFTNILFLLNNNPDIVIVVSSDFCHYGPNYGYTMEHATATTIRELDMAAFRHISEKNVAGFKGYLRETGNTICGRNAIILAMELINALYPLGQWTLLDYQQSSKIQTPSDNSVSYMSACYHL
jgi:AmmeMemoRadiSam system protein B